MSEATHTPGPWVIEEVCPDWEGVDIFAPQDGPPQLIASNVWRGNALLIAAAPDLFEALQQCLGSLKALGAENGHAAEAARAALAKASPSTRTAGDCNE